MSEACQHQQVMIQQYIVHTNNNNNNNKGKQQRSQGGVKSCWSWWQTQRSIGSSEGFTCFCQQPWHSWILPLRVSN